MPGAGGGRHHTRVIAQSTRRLRHAPGAVPAVLEAGGGGEGPGPLSSAGAASWFMDHVFSLIAHGRERSGGAEEPLP